MPWISTADILATLWRHALVSLSLSLVEEPLSDNFSTNCSITSSILIDLRLKKHKIKNFTLSITTNPNATKRIKNTWHTDTDEQQKITILKKSNEFRFYPLFPKLIIPSSVQVLSHSGRGYTFLRIWSESDPFSHTHFCCDSALLTSYSICQQKLPRHRNQQAMTKISWIRDLFLKWSSYVSAVVCLKFSNLLDENIWYLKFWKLDFQHYTRSNATTTFWTKKGRSIYFAVWHMVLCAFLHHFIHFISFQNFHLLNFLKN